MLTKEHSETETLCSLTKTWRSSKCSKAKYAWAALPFSLFRSKRYVSFHGYPDTGFQYHQTSLFLCRWAFLFSCFYFSPFLNIKASIVTKLTAVNLRIKLENNSLKSLIIRDWGRMGWTLTGIPDTPNQLITVTSPLNLQINITEDLFLIFWSETFPQETHKLQDYFLPFMLVKFRSTQKHRVNSSWWAYKSQTQTRQSK